MGKLAVYKYVAAMFLTIQVLISLFTFMGLFGGDVTPVGNTARAMSVYILPILIISNFIMMIYWLARRRWLFLLIPVFTVACCIPYIGTIYQFSFDNPQGNTQSGLKIASYNVAMFGRETSGFMAQDILAEMRRQKVDVLCIQEYSESSGDKKVSESYKDYFPYMQVGREDMVLVGIFLKNMKDAQDIRSVGSHGGISSVYDIISYIIKYTPPVLFCVQTV